MKFEFDCLACGEHRIIDLKPSHIKRGGKKVCDRECQRELYRVKFSGTGNPAFGKVYRSKETHPDWVKRISSGLKRVGHILGDKNPMRNPEIAKKMSKTRRENVTSDPMYRKARAADTRKAWAEGKYESVRVGKCKWFEHTKRDGTTVKVQGTWELAFAKWLDVHGLEYTAHRGRLPYIGIEDGAAVERSYYPDFFVEAWGCYVDVKSDYHHSLQSNKLELVRESNPRVKVRLLLESDLKKMGVI